MTKKGVFLAFVFLCLISSGCEKPDKRAIIPTTTPQQTPSQTWIDAPLPNSILPLAPYTIVFHGASKVGLSEFEVEINGMLIASVPPTTSSSGGAELGTLFLGEYLWEPPAPGTYLIVVKAKNGGLYGPADQVTVIVDGESIEESKPLDLAPSETVTITATPTSTPTPERAEPCQMTALVNLFCRPGQVYEPSDSFTPGQTAPVIARSQYLLKVIGANNGVECTVPDDDQLVKTDGDCDNLPQFDPPPPPTDTPTPLPSDTPTPKPEQGCTVRQPGGLIECVVPCPVGAAPGDACTP